MKLPFSFNLRFIYRNILPGFLLSLGFFPLINLVAKSFHIVINNEYLILISSIIFGWFLQVIDMHIYMVYEGRRYWPKFIKKYFIRRKQRHLLKLKNRYSFILERRNALSLEDENYNYINNEYYELSSKIRRFPVNSNGDRTAIFPTEIGNIIYSYESYTKIVYGINSIFYWNWIWMLLDKDLKEEIDSQQGLADSTIYTSFALNFNAILMIVYGINELIRFHHLYDIGLFEINIFYGYFFLLSFIQFLIAYLIYKSSIQLHISFGSIFRAVFDAYREKINVDHVIKTISNLTGDESYKEKDSVEKYEISWRYLKNYKIEMKGKKVSIHELKRKG